MRRAGAKRISRWCRPRVGHTVGRGRVAPLLTKLLQKRVSTLLVVSCESSIIIATIDRNGQTGGKMRQVGQRDETYSARVLDVSVAKFSENIEHRRMYRRAGVVDDVTARLSTPLGKETRFEAARFAAASPMRRGVARLV